MKRDYLNTTILLLYLLCFSKSVLAQGQDLNGLKQLILEAESERKKIEGVIGLGHALSIRYPDSLQYYYDSLSSPAFTETDLTMAGQLFLEAVDLYNKRQLSEAVGKFELAAERLKEANAIKLYFNCMNFLGITHNRMQEYNQAIQVYTKILETIPDTKEFSLAKQSAHGNISNAYKRLNEYASAIFHLEQTLALPEQQKNLMPRAMTYLSMGQMLSSLGLHNEALEAYLTIDAEKLPNASVGSTFFKSIALAHRAMGRTDSAIIYMRKAFTLSENKGRYSEMVSAILSSAELQIEQNDFVSAQQLLAKADTLCGEGYCPPIAYADFLAIKLKLEVSQDELEKAMALEEQLISFVNEGRIPGLPKKSYLTLASLYEKSGDKDKALAYQKTYTDLGFKLTNTQKELQQKQERTKLLELRAQQQVEESKAKESFYQRLTIQELIISIVLLILAIITFRYYRREKGKSTKATYQVEALEQELDTIQTEHAKEKTKYITLKSKALINLDKILYIASDGPYLELYLKEKEKPEIDRNSLKAITESLPSSQFVQVHRSHIVNLKHIKAAYASKVVLSNGEELNISRKYKDRLQEMLEASKN